MAANDARCIRRQLKILTSEVEPFIARLEEGLYTDVEKLSLISEISNAIEIDVDSPRPERLT